MAEALWNSDEIAAATGGTLRGQAFEATGVSIDTRSMKPGDLFVALAGENFDAHEFLVQARAAGAVAAVVSRMPAGTARDFPLILVNHTQVALEDLGRAARRRTKARIIGVTGSVGKTSAKEMLKLALAPYGQVYATAGNYNNHIGLPLTLANMPRKADFGVFEMGMNHVGEIEFLSRMAEPEVAIVTAVEAVHLEFFDSVSEIARAKAEIFSGMAAGCTAVLDADSPHLPILQQEAEKNELMLRLFGEGEEADSRLIHAECTVQGTAVEYLAGSKKRSFRLGSLGAHWPRLALGILAVVEALELSPEKAEKALAQFTEQPGRGQLVELPWQGGRVTVIDDAYNASPVSMRGALEKLGALKPAKGGRRIAVLGEMRELGPQSVRYHAELAPVIKAQKIDLALLAGEGMQALFEALPEALCAGYEMEAEALEPLLARAIRPGDIVLFKGSHGSHVYRLAAAFKRMSETQGEKEEAHAL